MFSRRSLPALATAALLLTAGVASAQTPAAPRAFEVATIKQSAPMDPAKLMSGQMHLGMSVDGARVDIGFLTLQQLIMMAYKIKPHQLEGPDWIKDQHWDILAKMPEGAKKDDVPEMLQQLLADRFKLSIMHKTTEQSVYALVPGKGGSKLKEADPDPAPAPASAEGEKPEDKPAAKGETVIGRGENQMRITQAPGGRGATVSNARIGQMKITPGENGTMIMEFSKLKMSDFADMLTGFIGKPVVDETEMKGSYKVPIELTMADMMRVARASGMAGMMGAAPAPPPSANPAEAASDPTGSLFAAVQKLGLKLDSKKASVDTIVVVHLEKAPTEN